jgi:LysM repeat protein
MSINEPRFDQEYEYDAYSEPGLTSVGLPPGQLALIIGVNAVISLVISIAVVLLVNRQAAPDEAAALAANTPAAVSEQAQPASLPEEPAPVGTPVQAVTYVVEAGDTLSAIAAKFAVPLSDLMTANGLTNRDFIQIGQELVIPLGGVSAATATFTPMAAAPETPLPFDPPTPLPAGAQVPREPAATVGPSPIPSDTPTITPTPIPTSTPPPFAEINVVVSEIIGAGDLTRETLVILNKGAGVSLKNWKLEGSSLGLFIFPDIFLFSGGSIRIHTAAGENTPSDLYLNQGEAAWRSGTRIILTDASNNQVTSLVAP